MNRSIHLIATFAFAISLHAQGTVNFANYVPGVLDAPVFGYGVGDRVEGDRYTAQLFAGPDAGSLEPIGAPVPFKSGAGAGYFLGGTHVIPAVAPGNSAAIQVWATDHVTGKTGASDLFIVLTGGAGSPPSLPADLIGLKSFVIHLPEPSTFQFALLGSGMAWIFLRRRREKQTQT